MNKSTIERDTRLEASRLISAIALTPRRHVCRSDTYGARETMSVKLRPRHERRPRRGAIARRERRVDATSGRAGASSRHRGGKIPQHFIDELLARVDVVEVIDARVTLKKTGRDHMACCPFHNEKTPSFSVSQPKQFYHCFGCGANGNAIGFLMEYENMHFVDAVEALAESVGLEVPRDEQAARQRDESRPLYATLEKVQLF